MLDDYELNMLMHESFGTRHDSSLEDTLINNQYEFIRFYEEGLKYQNNGAYLIITDKQFIFSKNGEDGKQGHMLSIVKTFLELQGKKNDVTLLESSRMYPEYDKNYLIFSFEVEKDQKSRSLEKRMRTQINRPLSPKEYLSFKTFYDIYGQIIDKCGFEFNIWDTKTHKYVPIKSIHKLLDYLSLNVDEEVKTPTLKGGEKILGVSNGTEQDKSKVFKSE